MRAFFTLLLSAYLGAVGAQISDDFSDGNLTSNPAWQGDGSNFVVNAEGQCQLNAPDAGTSQLFLPVSLDAATVWELYVQLDFTPSTSNFAQIWLQSDQLPLGSGGGYYVQLGETGTTDAIRVFKNDGSSQLIFSGTEGAIGSSDTVRVHLRIERTLAGEWTLLADYTGGNNLQLDGMGTDNTFTAADAQYAGWICTYTATRKDKFRFDNISISGEIFVDNTAPTIQNAAAQNDTTVVVQFSESVQTASVSTASVSVIGNQELIPVTSIEVLGNTATIHLGQALVSGDTYTVQCSNLTDLAGNITPTATSNTFSWVVYAIPTVAYEVLINEIMADPTPVVGLPDGEYVELLNRTTDVISLEGCFLRSGSTETDPFPQVLIPAGGYALLHKSSVSYTTSGTDVPISDMLALTNSGDDVALVCNGGTVIDQIQYDLTFYQSSTKDEGGWSMERINPLAPCTGADNWAASTAAAGGTPGEQNSTYAPVADDVPPQILSVYPLDAQHLAVTFSEVMNLAEMTNPANYLLSPDAQVVGAAQEDPSVPPTSVLLELSEPLQINQAYTLTFVAALADCNGLEMPQNLSIEVRLPEPVTAGTLVINEVLPDPQTGGVRFIEIFNPTQQVFDLSTVVIAAIRPDGESAYPIERRVLILPGQYVVFTPDPADILQRYTVPHPENMHQNSLPSLDANEDNVTLYTLIDGEKVYVDRLDYTPDFRNALLPSTDGISLERLSPDLPTAAPASWQSAAATAGNATPTGPNSQTTQPDTLSAGITLETHTVSPDGDGFEDQLLIHVASSQSGEVGNLYLYDAQGRLVRRLLRQSFIGSTATLRWDGDTDDGLKARLGPHIIWLEIISPDGTVRTFKATCVVAAKL